MNEKEAKEVLGIKDNFFEIPRWFVVCQLVIIALLLSILISKLVS